MRLIAMALTLAALLCGCSGGGERRPTPKRYAYPRPAALADSVATVAAGGVSFGISSSAVATYPREGWLDAVYPAYGATLHLSAIVTADPAKEIANRRERIGLNLGGAIATTRQFVNPAGFVCEMTGSAEGPATPVQFFAVGPAGHFVSGTFVVGGNTSPSDSIRPIVDILSAEAERILNSLQ